MCILGQGLVPNPRVPYGASTELCRPWRVQVSPWRGLAVPQGSHHPLGALSCSGS